jgi:flavin reductase (DIM6/NTAB) family NADH-FMN oxidoreductase RutF
MLNTLNPQGESPVGEQTFRDALKQFASGVTVITAPDEQGAVHGMTATAFSSLSLRPPLVLVAVTQGSRCHRFVAASKRFGVSVLFADQTQTSRHFGGKPSPDLHPAFKSLDDVPVLDEAMVRLACRLEKMVEGGDHMILIGLVTAVETSKGDPLLHFEGRYHGILRGPEG